MRITKNEIYWGLSDLKEEYQTKGREPYYFGVWWLDKETRAYRKQANIKMFGYHKTWYDHPIELFSFYFFEFCWFTQFSTSEGCFK